MTDFHPETQGPLVTIITATFNAAKTLEDTLKSVRDQDYPNIEHVIIDGGSRDGTQEIIRKNGSTIGFWLSEPDVGIYDAWNKGLRHAKGAWIAFLGADDQLLPGAVTAYMEIAKENPEAEFLSSRVRRLFFSKRPRVVGSPFVWSQFRRSMTVAHPGSMHKRSLFERLGNFDLNYRIVGDYELILRSKGRLRTAFLPRVTVEMMAGGVSDSRAALFEAYKAKRLSGGLPSWKALFDLMIALLKYSLRPLRR